MKLDMNVMPLEAVPNNQCLISHKQLLQTAVTMVTAVTLLMVAFSTNHSNGKVKVEKDKFVAIDAVKSHRGRRKMAPLILNLDARWRCVGNFVPSQMYPWGKDLGYQQ